MASYDAFLFDSETDLLPVWDSESLLFPFEPPTANFEFWDQGFDLAKPQLSWAAMALAAANHPAPPTPPAGAPQDEIINNVTNNSNDFVWDQPRPVTRLTKEEDNDVTMHEYYHNPESSQSVPIPLQEEQQQQMDTVMRFFTNNVMKEEENQNQDQQQQQQLLIHNGMCCLSTSGEMMVQQQQQQSCSPESALLDAMYIVNSGTSPSSSLKGFLSSRVKKEKRKFEDPETEELGDFVEPIDGAGGCLTDGIDEDDPTGGFKLPASKSPIMEAMVVCGLNGWGIDIVKNSRGGSNDPVEVVFRVTDFDRYYRISRSICSKQRPTDDVGSRVKSLRRWFVNFPKKKDRNDNVPFLLVVKPQIAKKVNEIIERNTRMLGLTKRRRRQ